jgi:hypothetical protein
MVVCRVAGAETMANLISGKAFACPLNENVEAIVAEALEQRFIRGRTLGCRVRDVALTGLMALVASDALAVCEDSGFATPVADGFDIAPYAEVTDPIILSFDADGNLFVGRDDQGSGGGAADPVKIHRIAPGGEVTEYGLEPIADPDTVLVDQSGAWAGVPGAVLVGSSISSKGHVFAILPDETIVTVFGPSSDFINPSDMKFDREDRLLFTDFNLGFQDAPSPQVVLSEEGEPPAQFVTHPTNPGNITFDLDNNLYMATVEGFVRVFDRDGALITDDFAGNLGGAVRIRFGPGGVWGEELIAIDTASPNRELLRIDQDGVATILGTNFFGVSDMTFGTDGALYFSRFQEDCVWRVAPTGTPLPGATGQPISGKELLLKWRPEKRKKRGIELLSKDPVIANGDVFGSNGDPVRTGATLRVVTMTGDGFDTTYVLPRERWRYVKKNADKRGFKFKGKDGPLETILVKPGKLLEHSLATDPDPVYVELRLGSDKYCMRFGGQTSFKPGKPFMAKKAPAPEACPLPR